MLTPKQWRLIQAALRYFDEELGPHGPGAFRADLADETVTAQELLELRELLSDFTWQFASRHSSSRDDPSTSGESDG